MRRVNWSMSTGSGRSIVDLLERVRTGSPFASAAQGVRYVRDEELGPLRRQTRRARWTAQALALAIALPFSAAVWFLGEAFGAPASAFAMAGALAVIMPVSVVLGGWGGLKAWAAAYLRCLDEPVPAGSVPAGPVPA